MSLPPLLGPFQCFYDDFNQHERMYDTESQPWAMDPQALIESDAATAAVAGGGRGAAASDQ